jgi:hypothetical protein
MARNGCHVAFCQRVPARYAMYPSPICFRKLLNASIFVLPDVWEAPPLGDGSTNLSFWGDEHHFTFKSFACTNMFGRSWNSQLSPLVSLKSWFEKKNLFDCLTLTYVFWFLSKFPTLPIEEVNFPKRWPHLSCRSCCWTRQASALYLDRQHGSAMKFYEILQSIFRCFILFLISMKFYESILDDVRWC